ncbi:energy transducer TonB [Massilia consociata]|uniref:Energy transducer TonB n=1 Tax=Massilia consociata TaxID=760117 RepID=A0ABV6FJX1_9BURK
MMRRLSSLSLMPTILATFAGCMAPSVALADNAATPAAIVFGSCPQKPAWPEAALQEKRQGAVVLAFEVDADSSVLEAKVKRSSGHPDLDEAARVGLAKCRFKAATQNGSPVRGWAELTYRWTLE